MANYGIVVFRETIGAADMEVPTRLTRHVQGYCAARDATVVADEKLISISIVCQKLKLKGNKEFVENALIY